MRERRARPGRLRRSRALSCAGSTPPLRSPRSDEARSVQQELYGNDEEKPARKRLGDLAHNGAEGAVDVSRSRVFAGSGAQRGLVCALNSNIRKATHDCFPRSKAPGLGQRLGGSPIKIRDEDRGRCIKTALGSRPSAASPEIFMPFLFGALYIDIAFLLCNAIYLVRRTNIAA